MTRTSNLVVATVSAFQLCYGPVLYHYIVSHLSGMFPVFPVFSIVFNSLETKYHTFSMQFRKKKNSGKNIFISIYFESELEKKYFGIVSASEPHIWGKALSKIYGAPCMF